MCYHSCREWTNTARGSTSPLSSHTQIYLHVNEINEAATSLYTRCGYEDAPSCPSSRAFTTKLGLSGGFYGQRHRLMRKMIAGAGYNDEDDNDGRDDENNDDDESPPTESTV